MALQCPEVFPWGSVGDDVVSSVLQVSCMYSRDNYTHQVLFIQVRESMLQSSQELTGEYFSSVPDSPELISFI